MGAWWKFFQIPPLFKGRSIGLLRFAAPSQTVLEQIRVLLCDLKPTRSAPKDAGSVYVDGDIEGVLQGLRDVLDQDYAENLQEVEVQSWSFEYIVCRSANGRRLEVLTRLYGQEFKGAILYGRFIVRLDETHYRMRVDD